MKILIEDDECDVVVQRCFAVNNQLVIEIYYDTGESDVISTCIADYPFTQDQTTIGSEVDQQHVVRELARVGLIETYTGSEVFSGYASYPVVTLINPLRLYHLDHDAQSIFATNGKGNLFCYRKGEHDQFQLFHCTRGLIALSSNEVDYYLPRTPLPEGVSKLEKVFTQWLIQQRL